MNEPAITKASSAFSLECGVTLTIQADAETIWRLLTDAKDFPRWNSTVTAIEGQISDGQTLRVHVPGTKQTFTPTVSGVVRNKGMVWTGGFAPMFKGVRTFQLKQVDDKSTEFTMHERFSGLMLPLIKRSLPDFGPIFARYGSDLKSAAEAAQARK